MDAEMASWKSTGTYVDEVPPPGANIVSGMWIFRGVDYCQTFSPTPKMTTLWVLLHVAAQRDYERHSLDFSTAFLQGNLHEEIWLRRPPGFTGSFSPSTQWSLRRPVYSLGQVPREWHDTLRTTLAALGFAPSTADPSLFLRTDTSLPPFYILVYVLQRFDFTYSSSQATPLSTRHSLSALPSDESVEPSGPYPELVGCLMYLMTCTRPDLACPLSILARYVAPGRHRPEHMAAAKRGYTFGLGYGSVLWRCTRSSSVLSSSCEAEIYAGAMAAQELRWLTYLQTDLGEPPRSPPVLYVNNKAMLALCREHRLEHRTKHNALRYFLARELQQRGQLRLAYVASEANTADIFTKALPPACFALLDWSSDLLFSPTLPMGGDPDAPDIPTPCSYVEAITGPYSSQWQAAMDAEMASWKSTCTYVDEVPPPGVNVVDGMWIFRVKRPPGSPPAFKARYVARGFSQRQGVDYFQTFSPTQKMTTLRGSLHEEIWLRQPPGFTGSFPTGTQWSLRWPVYGLREAPREWHDTFRTTLAALGFVPSTADPSLFLCTDTSLPPFYVLVYVDDLVFATADTEALTLVKSELQKRHTCTDLGEQRSYLGLHITRDRARRTITLTQSHMVHQVLQRFGFQYSSPQLTPLSTSHLLSAPHSDESVEPSGLYPELVGCLMYLMTCTRPDLAYPLSLLARYVAPGRHRKVHWDAAKRVLRYLCSTSGMGLFLGGRGPVVLTGHADASWVDDSATQRSSQGYTFSLGSGSVSWRSTRSSSVLSSSCEAEIYAGAMAAQELRWLTYLLTDLREQPRSPPVLYVDNKAMIALCQEHKLEHRTKHIALRYFLARELQ
ncbi:unnamed protein product [Closterium sp. NIES-53]